MEESQPKQQILSQTPSLASLQKGAKILHSEDQRSSKASSSNEEAYIRKLEERIRNQDAEVEMLKRVNTEQQQKMWALQRVSLKPFKLAN